MIRSMTAFAQAEQREGDLTAAVEIRSVNSRYLDLSLRLFNGNPELEERLKKQVAARLERGRVDVKVHIADGAARAAGLTVNVARAAALRDALMRLKAVLRLEGDLPLEVFTAAGDVIVPVEPVPDAAACRRLAQGALATALDDLVAMREEEGRQIAADFENRLNRMESWVGEIADGSQHLLRHYREKLSERILLLTDGVVDLDPGRIAQEAAFLADRSDISEEILRARSHLDQFRAIVGAEAPSGRKLNFLLQEIARELNTMGSKTEKAELAHRVVEMKCELEKIREQVQNVE
jgi:uncharacterized protein (TIGR00255 family)